jgi:hypothetical protein
MNPNPSGSLLDRVAELEAENARLKALLPKWISVSERLPEFGAHVLTADGNTVYENSLEDGDMEGGLSWDCEYQGITHWMPLPPPPSSTQDGHDNKEEA